MSPRLVLASQSPRRAELLRALRLTFDVAPPAIDETHAPDESPARHAERLAREKALAVARRRPAALVVGSDTVVVVDGAVLGKPRDEDDAVAMLMRLQGRAHSVETGVAVAFDGERVISTVASVRVVFRPFDVQTASDYVATGEPMDKAGAYGIQGFGATLVERIDGDFFAVMGLPIVSMLGLLEQLGWRYAFGRGLQRIGTAAADEGEGA
ncbi:MAG: septum formation inhibitor Maf [Candidatus Cloacimonetes bacterium]|nr:septum formation inhibitor Maf [Candidatus Cloacimonadota bacterium]